MRRLVLTTCALALLLAGCAGGDDLEVDGLEPDAPAQEDGEGDEDDAASSPDADAAQEDPAEQEDPGEDPDAPAESSGEDDGSSPSPDPDALGDPCAEHEDRGGEAFIEVVAPVDDQEVTGELEVVGCSSVPEGTIQYRMLTGDGETLDEGFFTAECGGPCIGEFRETLDLDVAEGEPVVYVQFYWEDMGDGSERDLEERIVVLG